VKLTGNVFSFLYCFGIPMAVREQRAKREFLQRFAALAIKVIIKSRLLLYIFFFAHH
jgi:hypothetical protein